MGTIQRAAVSKAGLWNAYFEAYDARMELKNKKVPTNWWNRFKFFEEKIYAAKEGQIGYDHADLQRAYQGLQEVGFKPTPEANIWGRALDRIYSRRQTDATVICEMWDSETETWYSGRSGHGSGRGSVPAGIWGDIPVATDEDFQEWAFGRNCAEVDCIIRAYAAGKTQTDLRDCFFVAYHIPMGKKIGPCKTCRAWIGKHGGKAYSPN